MMEGQADILLATLEDISNGYSQYYLNFTNQNNVCFKHLNHFELLEIRKNYNLNLNIAKQNGILLEKDQIQIAYDYKWWSKEKEADLESTSLSIKRLKKTKSKLIYQSDKSRIEEQIKTQEDRFKKLQEEKSAYVTITAEDWSSRKTTDYFLQNFLYKDTELKLKFFNESNDFELAEDYIIDELTIYYYKFLTDFSDKKIKQLAISSFFQNIIYISQCTSKDVFGVPSIRLTKNQSDLLIFAKYYQNIIKNSDGNIPDSVYEDPDKILEWFEAGKKHKENVSGARNKLKNKPNGDNSSSFLFGNREEVKAISGGEVSGDKILQETKEKGDLGIYDLIKK
jgi:hypothetical protein